MIAYQSCWLDSNNAIGRLRWSNVLYKEEKKRFWFNAHQEVVDSERLFRSCHSASNPDVVCFLILQKGV